MFWTFFSSFASSLLPWLLEHKHTNLMCIRCSHFLYLSLYLYLYYSLHLHSYQLCVLIEFWVDLGNAQVCSRLGATSVPAAAAAALLLQQQWLRESSTVKSVSNLCLRFNPSLLKIHCCWWLYWDILVCSRVVTCVQCSLAAAPVAPLCTVQAAANPSSVLLWLIYWDTLEVFSAARVGERRSLHIVAVLAEVASAQ